MLWNSHCLNTKCSQSPGYPLVNMCKNPVLTCLETSVRRSGDERHCLGSKSDWAYVLEEDEEDEKKRRHEDVMGLKGEAFLPNVPGTHDYLKTIDRRVLSVGLSAKIS